MTGVVHAAGAVLWRERRGKLEVLLVHRPTYDDWAWPKGKVEKGESLPAAAVREVEEETGYRVALSRSLGTVRYRLKDGRHKESHYWAANADAPVGIWDQARGKVKRAPKKEIDETRWVGAKQAAKLLTYPHDREPLFQLLDEYNDDRLRTWTVLIVRHARAKKREAFDGPEERRPLTEKQGRDQAKRLMPLLSAYGVARVITSPWERCAATVEPYANVIGAELETASELTEAAHEKKPKKVTRLIREEMFTPGEAVALCTHRPVMPTIIEALTEHTPYRIMEQLPETDPWLKPAEVLVVHLAAHHKGRVIVTAIEHQRPIG
ncbi:NUDIX hydrolase [Bowdeniella massiliensis]|uniref:NUDIX hydrolase n=1 Tax=Bowdeniella massiliensis TaxID=2932264 RepID=UPI0020279CEE